MPYLLKIALILFYFIINRIEPSNLSLPLTLQIFFKAHLFHYYLYLTLK